MQKAPDRLQFAIYVRKSSEGEDRQVLSIESQLETLQEYAKKNNFEVLEVFQDSASAHKRNNRPGFDALIESIESEKVNAIIAWKPDRLARNMIEGGAVIHLLQTGIIQCIQTPHSRYVPTDNMLTLTVELGMANQFSRDLSVNIKRGNKTKSAKGGWCGVAPHGYLNDRVNKTIIPDPERFYLVRKMWDLALTGQYSLPQICDVLNNEFNFRTIRRKKIGGGELAHSSLHQILKNPFYYGKIVHGGIETRGSHEAMITEKEFETVQQILSRVNRRAETNYVFAFTDMIKCGECDCSITAEEKVKYACPSCRKQCSTKREHDCKRCRHKISQEVIGKGKYYTYYRCTKKKGKCTQKFISKAKLELQIREVLQQVQMDSRLTEWSLKWLKYLHENQTQQNQTDLSLIKKSYAQAQQRLNALLNAYLDQSISKEVYESKKKELETERSKWNDKLQALEKGSDEWFKRAEKDFELAIEIDKKFQNGVVRDKKFIIKEIGSNLTLKDGKLTLRLKPEFELIKALDKDISNWLEPSKTLSGKGLDKVSDSLYPSWYTR